MRFAFSSLSSSTAPPPSSSLFPSSSFSPSSKSESSYGKSTSSSSPSLHLQDPYQGTPQQHDTISILHLEEASHNPDWKCKIQGVVSRLVAHERCHWNLVMQWNHLHICSLLFLLMKMITTNHVLLSKNHGGSHKALGFLCVFLFFLC